MVFALLVFKTQQVSAAIIPGITGFWEHSLPHPQIRVWACLQPHVRWHRGRPHCGNKDSFELHLPTHLAPPAFYDIPPGGLFSRFRWRNKRELDNYRTSDVSTFHWGRVAFMQIISPLVCGLKCFLPGPGTWKNIIRLNCVLHIVN